MNNLTGYVESYNDYLRREKNSLRNLPMEKMYHVWYAEELVKPVFSGTILFYSSNAYGFAGVPRILLQKILAEKGFESYKFIVCLRSREMIQKLKEEGFHDRRIHYIRMGKGYPRKFWKYAARAQYLVTDGSVCRPFIPRKEQTCIQTAFLYDGRQQGYQRAERYSVENLEEMTELLAADYIVSPSDFYTREILEGAYRLDDAGSGRVITCGSPVVDALLKRTEEQAVAVTEREYKRTGKRELLVATSEKNAGVGMALELQEFMKTNAAKDYEIYFKPAQTGYRKTRKWFEQNHPEGIHLLLNETDVLNWIKRCDVVVADYGEHFFYSIAAGKTVILYDRLDSRTLQRDFMNTVLETVPVVHTPEQLGNCLESAPKPASGALVSELFASHAPADAVFDVLRGEKDRGQELGTGRERVMVVATLGHLTRDLLLSWEKQLTLFLSMLVQGGRDVTLFSDYPESDFYRKKIEGIVPEGVRILYRIAERVMTNKDKIDSSYLIRNLAYCDDIGRGLDSVDCALMGRDVRRNIGNLKTDTVIYAGPLSMKYLIQVHAMEAKKKYFWDQRNYAAAFQVEFRDEKNTQRFHNFCAVPELFERVLHWDGTELNILRKNHLIRDEKKHIRLQDYFDLAGLVNREPMDSVTLRGQEYWVTNTRFYQDDQCDMQVLAKYKTREERKAVHVTYAFNGRFEEMIQELCRKHEKHPDWIFYLFDDQMQSSRELDMLASANEMQDYVVLCSNFFLWSEVSEFSEYFYIENDIYEILCRETGVAYTPLFAD